MIIGLVLCGLVAVLLFVGVAERVFKSFGVTYWLAFVMVGLLIGSAFIPSFAIAGVEFNVAGFVAPVIFAGIFFALCKRSHEVWRATVAFASVAAIAVAIELLIDPIVNDVVSVIILGFLCGAMGFLVARTKLSSLAAIFAGLPIGDVIATVVGKYAYGTPLSFGSAATFDAIILAAVFSVALFEAVAAVKRTMNARAKVNAELAEEFDPDEYKKYFDE